MEAAAKLVTQATIRFIPAGILCTFAKQASFL